MGTRTSSAICLLIFSYSHLPVFDLLFTISVFYFLFLICFWLSNVYFCFWFSQNFISLFILPTFWFSRVLIRPSDCLLLLLILSQLYIHSYIYFMIYDFLLSANVWFSHNLIRALFDPNPSEPVSFAGSTSGKVSLRIFGEFEEGREGLTDNPVVTSAFVFFIK